VRHATAKVRLLALAIAAAIAVPANLPTWPVDDGASATSLAARGDNGAPGRPALNGVTPRPTWHTGCMVCGDPSDEPDEGSDGWVPASDRALPSEVAPAVPATGSTGLASAASARSPLPVVTLYRLRC
jgi:hypothetical protein